MMYFEKILDIVDMTQLNSCNIFVTNFLLITSMIWHFCDTIKNKIVSLSKFFDMIECKNLTNDMLYQMYKPVFRSYNCRV